MRMRVGETTIAWVGTIPVDPFFTKVHSGVAALDDGAEAARGDRRAKRRREGKSG